mmetsp:Transcript_22707/g.52986  ORF Transcript_22707/g.52986 Transcript_22707/m.52986 type:complete len:560 (+) Transcript_22707:1-1680(+)
MRRWVRAASRTKSIQQIRADLAHEGGGDSLQKVLSRVDIVAYGIGSMVGAGIFVTVGSAAQQAGPAITLSFILAATCCFFTALCYGEFASRVPVAGSAYIYVYAVLGEFAAWLVGWNLILEYTVATSAVARGWSSNVVFLFSQFNVEVPEWTYAIHVGGGRLDLLAAFLFVSLTLLVLLGVKESATVNLISVCLCVGVISFVIIFGAFHITPSNWTADPPPGLVPSGCDAGGYFPCGAKGVIATAGYLFYSFIGFDCVTALSEEVRNPTKDIPFGIVFTLGTVSLLYIGSTFVLTGMVPWYALDPNTAMASAFDTLGFRWASILVSVCTVVTVTVCTLCGIIGQPRILYGIAKDGLMPRALAHLSKRTKEPDVGTVATGLLGSLLALFVELDTLVNVTSLGTLNIYAVVCAGVVLLRVESPKHPAAPGILLGVLTCGSLLLGVCVGQGLPVPVVVVAGVAVVGPIVAMATLPRTPPPADTYTCPLIPFVPMLGMAITLYLSAFFTPVVYESYAIWLVVGAIVWAAYGVRKSKLVDSLQHSASTVDSDVRNPLLDTMSVN